MNPIAASSSARFLRACLPMAAMIALTILVFSLYDVYLPVNGDLAPELHPAAGASPAAASWKTSGLAAQWFEHGGPEHDGAIQLPASGGHKSFLDSVVPNVRRHAYLRVRARAQCQDVRPDGTDWMTARIVCAFRDADGCDHWELNHTVCELENTRAWHEYRQVFAVPDWAVSARISVHNLARTGVFRVADLRVEPVVTNPANRLLKPALIFLWCWVAWHYVRRLGILRLPGGWLLLALQALILVAVLMPGPWLDQVMLLTYRSVHAVPAAGAEPPPVPSHAAAPMPPRQTVVFPSGFSYAFHVTGHLAAFMILGAFIAWSQAAARGWRLPRNLMGRILAACLLLGAADETLQLLTLTRTAEVQSAFNNFIGMGIGCLLVAAALAFWRRNDLQAGPAKRHHT